MNQNKFEERLKALDFAHKSRDFASIPKDKFWKIVKDYQRFLRDGITPIDEKTVSLDENVNTTYDKKEDVQYDESRDGRRIRRREVNPNEFQSRFNKFFIENVLDRAILDTIIGGLPRQRSASVRFTNDADELVAILDNRKEKFFLSKEIYGELCKINHNWNANVMRIKHLLADYFDSEEFKDYSIDVCDLTYNNSVGH